MNKYETINDLEIMEIDGGFIVTGAAVVAGVGLFYTGFQIGKDIGKAIKKK